MCRALPDPSRPRLGGRAACCLSRRPFPRRRSPVKKYIIAVLLGTGAVGAIGAGKMTSAPASAPIRVFDPANYRQNLLTAARTLKNGSGSCRERVGKYGSIRGGDLTLNKKTKNKRT